MFIYFSTKFFGSLHIRIPQAVPVQDQMRQSLFLSRKFNKSIVHFRFARLPQPISRRGQCKILHKTWLSCTGTSSVIPKQSKIFIQDWNTNCYVIDILSNHNGCLQTNCKLSLAKSNAARHQRSDRLLSSPSGYGVRSFLWFCLSASSSETTRHNG